MMSKYSSLQDYYADMHAAVRFEWTFSAAYLALLSLKCSDLHMSNQFLPIITDHMSVYVPTFPSGMDTLVVRVLSNKSASGLTDTLKICSRVTCSGGMIFAPGPHSLLNPLLV